MDSNSLATTIDESTSVPTTSSCMEIVNLPILDAEQAVNLSRFLDQSGLSIPAIDSSGQPITVSINVIDGLQGAGSTGISSELQGTRSADITSDLQGTGSTDIISTPVSVNSSANQTIIVKPILQNCSGTSNSAWTDDSSILSQQVGDNSGPVETSVTTLNTLTYTGGRLESIPMNSHTSSVIQVNDNPVGSEVIQISPLMSSQDKLDKSSRQFSIMIQSQELLDTTGVTSASSATEIGDTVCQNIQEEKQTNARIVDSKKAMKNEPEENKISYNNQLMQIFSKIEAFLSDEALNVLLSQAATFLNDTQDKLTWNRRSDTNLWSVSGNILDLYNLQQKFSKVLTGKESDIDLQPIRPEMKVKATQTDPVQQLDFAVMCDILVPAVSAYGRGIKQPARFNQNYNDLHLDTDESQNERVQERSKVNRRKRKIPRRSKVYMEESDTIDASTAVPCEEAAQRTCEGLNTSEVKGEETIGDRQTNADCQIESTADAVLRNFNDVTVKENLPQSSTFSDRKSNQWKRSKKDYEALAPFKFFCKQCSFKTKRQSHFKKHCKLHVDSGTLYECQQCNFKTIRNSTLKRHEVTHSKVFFPCDKCKYVSDSATLLFKHKKLKHFENSEMSNVPEKTQYQCSVCSYKTTKPASYNRHLQSHGKDFIAVNGPMFQVTIAEYQCEHCTYKTRRREHYVRHINNVHSDHRPYLCDLCGRSFKRTDALTQHKLTHIDKQFRKYPFKCSECQKDFRSQAHLTEHKSMHSNTRQFLCDICGAAFKTKSCQQKHVRSIHQNPRSYSCDLCTKKFNTKFALQRHVRTHDQNQTVAMIPVEQKAEDISRIETPITSQTLQAVLQHTTNLSEQDMINTNIEEYEQTNLPGSESATAIMHLPELF